MGSGLNRAPYAVAWPRSSPGFHTQGPSQLPSSRSGPGPPPPPPPPVKSFWGADGQASSWLKAEGTWAGTVKKGESRAGHGACPPCLVCGVPFLSWVCQVRWQEHLVQGSMDQVPPRTWGPHAGSFQAPQPAVRGLCLTKAPSSHDKGHRAKPQAWSKSTVGRALALHVADRV